MNEEKTYLALFHMDKNGAKWKAWHAASEEKRNQNANDGVAAVKNWEKENRESIVYVGGPLGSTLRLCDGEISSVINQLTVFIVVKALSHEAATRLLSNHPHLTHFPCHAVEVMPILGE